MLGVEDYMALDLDLRHERMDKLTYGLTKVFQEVLAGLKSESMPWKT